LRGREYRKNLPSRERENKGGGSIFNYFKIKNKK
jgi:hypothetical protein